MTSFMKMEGLCQPSIQYRNVPIKSFPESARHLRSDLILLSSLQNLMRSLKGDVKEMALAEGEGRSRVSFPNLIENCRSDVGRRLDEWLPFLCGP